MAYNGVMKKGALLTSDGNKNLEIDTGISGRFLTSDNIESLGIKWSNLPTNLTKWTEVTTTSAVSDINNGYITNNSILVNVVLPLVSAVGDFIQVVGKGVGLFKISQPSPSSIISMNSSSTTLGLLGSITALQRYSCLNLRCVTENSRWVVESSQGTFTIF